MPDVPHRLGHGNKTSGPRRMARAAYFYQTNVNQSLLQAFLQQQSPQTHL